MVELLTDNLEHCWIEELQKEKDIMWIKPDGENHLKMRQLQQKSSAFLVC